MAKCIMIQGTMSNAGKSIIAAGLCRILKQDGYRVAPFKSQNMALNSYITEDNLEMGRAQVVQAEACGIKPCVDMNPILLKPTTNMGSQVIVQGQVTGDMSATEYFRHKRDYIPIIMDSYNRLSEEYDIIVIEGAGSPAEINLKQDDIVNMGLAELVDAPVILVGDIDRGGVFAQLIGTVMLLEQKERDRIKGLVVNKFRGDKTILEPGLDMIYDRCNKPVIGVVPYMELDIEDEDSLSELLNVRKSSGDIDIAVIRLSKISNFTDFQALSAEEGVSVRYVTGKDELGKPDLVIIPGTKNTIADMKWLRETGLEGAVKRLASEGCLICGICGGYQLLGQSITDHYGVEGEVETISGMGLLPVATEFEQSKRRTQIHGRVAELEGDYKSLSGMRVSGYEIHMGKTFPVEDGDKVSAISMLKLEEQGGIKFDGFVKDNVMGTYLHGIFDEEEFRTALLSILYKRKGMDYDGKSTLSYAEYKEQQFDKLAQSLRDNLDMDMIYEIMGLKKREL
ncbi:MAG: cobyric acid synthase [Wujia sp.]